MVEKELEQFYDGEMEPYCYPTKSGLHIVVQPFNRAWLHTKVAELIHENPIMLWGY